MRILLCNDTGTKSHIGCLGVSDAHARLLGRAGHRVEYRCFVNDLAHYARKKTPAETTALLTRDEELMARIEAVDAVIVNGEGTIHHNGGHEYISLLKLAKQKGKAALLVNSLFQDLNTEIDPDVMNSLDAFFVRDPRSLAYAKSLGIRCSYAPDSVVEAQFGNRPGVDYAGGLLVTDWVGSREEDVGVALLRLLSSGPTNSPHRFFPLHSSEMRATWRSAVESLKTARLLVTGRYHAMYLAVLAGTPFVAMASNSWKIQGFLESVGLNQPILSNYAELSGNLEALAASRSSLAEARDRLLGARPLKIFEVLGKGSEATSEDEEISRLEAQVLARPDRLHQDKCSIAQTRVREADMMLQLITGEEQTPPSRTKKTLAALKSLFEASGR